MSILGTAWGCAGVAPSDRELARLVWDSRPWARRTPGNVAGRVWFIDEPWEASYEVIAASQRDRHLIAVSRMWTEAVLARELRGEHLVLHAEPIEVPGTDGLEVYAGLWAIEPNDRPASEESGAYVGGGRWSVTRRGVIVRNGSGHVEFGKIGNPRDMNEGAEMRAAIARARERRTDGAVAGVASDHLRTLERQEKTQGRPSTKSESRVL